MDTDPISRHLRNLKRRNMSPGTIDQRGGALDRLQRHIGKPVLEATGDDLDTWQDGLNVSISAVATYSSHVRAFFTWAVREGLVTVNPATDLVAPKIHTRRPRPIPEEDLQAALAATCGITSL